MKVVVVVFCRDRPAYLPATLESVADQEFRDFDVVVSDNSTCLGKAAQNADITRRTLPGTRVDYLRQTGELSMSGHFFKVIPKLAAVYDVVAIHNDDDIWLPCHLARAIDGLSGSANICLSIANATVIDECGKTIAPRFCVNPPPAGLPRSRQLAHFVTSFWGTFPGYVAKSSLLGDLPEVDSQQLDGWIAWWCLATRRDIHYVDEPTFLYRRHPAQVTNLGPSVLSDKHRLRIQAFQRFCWHFTLAYPGFPLKALKSWLWCLRNDGSRRKESQP